MIHIHYPLSGARKNKATSALEQGVPVRIGFCSLFPEEGLIWGVDAYGLDRIAASSITRKGAEQAIEWVERQYQGENDPWKKAA